MKLTFLLKFAAFAISILLFLFGAGAALANDLKLTPGEDATLVAAHVEFTRVSNVNISSAEIEDAALSLKPLPSNVMHFGPAQGPILVHINVENAGSENGNWILFTGRGAFKSIRIWRLDGQNSRLLLDGDDRNALRENLRSYQAFSSELSLAAKEKASFAIIFESENSTYLPLEIITLKTFFTERRANIAMVSGVTVGALILVFLNIIFFGVTGQKEFIWLGLAEIAFALNTVHAEGYTTIFLFPGQTGLSMIFENTFKCAFAVFMSQFARVFIQTKENFPKIDWFLKTIIIFGTSIIVLQPATFFLPEALQTFLYYFAWSVAAISALTLPFIGIAATYRLGSQYWPLILAWGSLGLFIFYAAVASVGIIPNLPIYWSLAGPIGLFEVLMATFALALHIRRIRSGQIRAELELTQSLKDRLKMSERANVLHSERAAALASLSDQSSLLYASGHDMRQVVGTIKTAAHLLESKMSPTSDSSLPDLLKASALYLEDIAVTSMSAPVAGVSGLELVSLSGFDVDEILKPLERIYRTICLNLNIELKVINETAAFLISDRAILMRAISNLLSNAVKFSGDAGHIFLRVSKDGDILQIELTDEGAGVTSEFAKQLNTSESNRLRADETFSGSGTGFAAAKRIIATLGGSLQIEPRMKKGTRVRVLLPLCQSKLTPATLESLQNKINKLGGEQELLDGDSHRVNWQNLDDISPIAVTFDDSMEYRMKFSSKASLIILKPLYIEMALHPLVIQKEGGPAFEALEKVD